MNSYFVSKTRLQSKLPKTACALAALMLIAGYAGGLTWAAETESPEAMTDITVYKSPLCGCCDKWVEQLRANGFTAHVKTMNDTSGIKSSLAIPTQLRSCHTAVVGDYWVEGHVPADLILKLLEEKPAGLKGIAVPGMVPGSPGMESPQPRTYQVLSVDDKGQVAVYATREGASQP